MSFSMKNLIKFIRVLSVKKYYVCTYILNSFKSMV